MAYTAEDVAAQATVLAVDTLYSEKKNFAASQVLGIVHFLLGLIAAVIGGFAGFTGLSDLGASPNLVAWLALVAAVVTGLNTFLRLDQRRDAHHRHGSRYKDVRKQMRLFIHLDCNGDHPPEVLLVRLESFRSDLAAIDSEVGSIPKWAYWLAKWGIAKGESDYTEEEARSAIGS